MKAFLFLLFMTTCSVSWAEWEYVGETNNYVDFVDRESIRRNGKFAEMWERSSYFEYQMNSDGKKFNLTKTLIRYDCINDTLGIIMFVQYKTDEKGTHHINTISSINNQIIDRRVIPDSSGQKKLKIACGIN
jgi:hypothetical protein